MRSQCVCKDHIVRIDGRGQRRVVCVGLKLQSWKRKIDPTPFPGYRCRVDMLQRNCAAFAHEARNRWRLRDGFVRGIGITNRIVRRWLGVQRLGFPGQQFDAMRRICLCSDPVQNLRTLRAHLRTLRLVHALPVGTIYPGRLQRRNALRADLVVNLLLDALTQSEVEVELATAGYQVFPEGDDAHINREPWRDSDGRTSPGAHDKIYPDSCDSNVRCFVHHAANIEPWEQLPREHAATGRATEDGAPPLVAAADSSDECVDQRVAHGLLELNVDLTQLLVRISLHVTSKLRVSATVATCSSAMARSARMSSLLSRLLASAA